MIFAKISLPGIPNLLMINCSSPHQTSSIKLAVKGIKYLNTTQFRTGKLVLDKNWKLSLVIVLRIQRIVEIWKKPWLDRKISITYLQLRFRNNYRASIMCSPQNKVRNIILFTHGQIIA